MNSFSQSGSFNVSEDVLRSALTLFEGFCLDDEGTKVEINSTYQQTGMVIDPHSAIGLAGARHAKTSGLISQDTAVISLACAHPAKFPDAVKSACGIYPDLPKHLSDLMRRDDAMLTVENNMDAVQTLLRAERR